MVRFTPVTTGEGAFGECDRCGALFRLKDGQTDVVRPPKSNT
jgi:hypothetical protein